MFISYLVKEGKRLTKNMSNESICNDPLCERVRNGEKHTPHDLSVVYQQQSKSFIDVLRGGFKLGGTSIGAGVGFVLGGPIGALGGAALAKAIELVGEELSNRYLSRREKERTGYCFILTCDKIKRKLESGEKIQNPNFFTEKSNERAPISEITEGVLIAAQKEYQEKKLPYFSNLLANIAFSNMDLAQANLLLSLSQKLSYSQFCLLTLFSNSQKFNLKVGDYRGGSIKNYKTISILQESYELYSLGLLNASGEALLGLGDINPSKMKLQGSGAVLYSLLELHTIPNTDLQELANILQ